MHLIHKAAAGVAIFNSNVQGFCSQLIPVT